MAGGGGITTLSLILLQPEACCNEVNEGRKEVRRRGREGSKSDPPLRNRLHSRANVTSEVRSGMCQPTHLSNRLPPP